MLICVSHILVGLLTATQCLYLVYVSLWWWWWTLWSIGTCEKLAKPAA